MVGCYAIVHDYFHDLYHLLVYLLYVGFDYESSVKFYIMHALKVTWSGQAFALAKCNDSQGRKSRVRRSKEERRTMVESFINE